MAENNIISVVVTNANRLPDLSIKNSQLIFIRDIQRIALDFNGVRKFYNEIVELKTEQERIFLTPVVGLFYFVIESAVLWTYQTTGWIQVTNKPEDIVYIGVELPEMGNEKSLYVNKEEKNISVWDDTLQDYVEVADCTASITEGEITNLFNG